MSTNKEYVIVKHLQPSLLVSLLNHSAALLLSKKPDCLFCELLAENILKLDMLLESSLHWCFRLDKPQIVLIPPRL